MPRDNATLLDIDRAARLAQVFAEGYSKEEFLEDLKTQSAVVHQLLIIGEAMTAFGCSEIGARSYLAGGTTLVL